jgi:hypothetical protein
MILGGMNNKKKVHVKMMENVTDEELNQLVEGLKKIEGFNFTIDSFVIVSQTSYHDDQNVPQTVY